MGLLATKFYCTSISLSMTCFVLYQHSSLLQTKMTSDAYADYIQSHLLLMPPLVRLYFTSTLRMFSYRILMPKSMLSITASAQPES